MWVGRAAGGREVGEMSRDGGESRVGASGEVGGSGPAGGALVG